MFWHVDAAAAVDAAKFPGAAKPSDAGAMTKFHILTTAEADATAEAVEKLKTQPWANALLQNIETGGGLTAVGMSFLFEARIAWALHDCGVVPDYEHPTGVGDTSVDFHFNSWFVELLSLQETDAAKAAAWEDGPFFGRLLSSPQPPAPDEKTLGAAERQQLRNLRKRSPEGETLKTIQRIVGKAGDDGGPLKFPEPDGTHLSMLIVDLRTIAPIDREDCRQIAYGAGAVPDYAKYRWIDDDGREIPIIGVFDAGNRMKGAQYFHERVHFLGLVAEKTYEREELRYAIRFYHNPHLFPSMEEARAALHSFPLYQPEKTRERLPEHFLHEVFKVDGATIQFGVVIDGKTVLCHVHRDTLEDLEEKEIEAGSDEMIEAFHRRNDDLRELALEKARRDLVESDGTIFIKPDDLKLISHRPAVAAVARGTRWI